MGKSQSVDNMLKNKDPDQVLKGLTILYNHPRNGFISEVKLLGNSKNIQIGKLAKKLLVKLESFENSLVVHPKLNVAEDFIKLYKTLTKTTEKGNLLKEFEIAKFDTISEFEYEDILSLYLFEANKKSAIAFSKLMYKTFNTRFQADLLKNISTDNNNILVNAMIGLIHFENQIGVEKVADIYQTNVYPEFIYFCSCYLWNYSKLLVCSRLKELARKDLPRRTIVAKTCITLADIQLFGIVNLLLDDTSDKVKALARTAYNAIEKKTSTAENFLIKFKSLSTDYSKKFAQILKNGKDFHEKILVANILDNLGQKDFIPVIVECLETETNNFVLATYIKFICKFGEHQYLDVIRPFLTSNDNRIVANCIEGLAYGPIDRDLVKFFKSKIKHEDFRIALMCAFALWKYEDQLIVINFFSKNIQNTSIWKRKAILKLIIELNDPDLKELVTIMLDDPDEEIKQKANEFLNNLMEVDAKERFTSEKIIDYIIEQGKIPDNIIMKKIRLLSSDNPLSEKLKAARELSYIATDEHYTHLYTCYIAAKDPLLKAELVKTIGYTFSEGKEFLFDKLQEEKNERILIYALEGLSNYNIKNDLKIIFSFLSHENPLVIQMTARLLNQYIPEELPGKINNMLKSPNADIRRCALYAICEMKTFDNFVIVRKMLNDKDLNVAITASEVLKQFDITDEFNKNYQNVITEELNNEKTILKDLPVNPEHALQIIHKLRSSNDKIRLDALTTILTDNSYEKLVLDSLSKHTKESEIFAEILFKILNNYEIKTEASAEQDKSVNKAGEWENKKKELKKIYENKSDSSNKTAILKILLLPFILIFSALAFFIYSEYFDSDNTRSSNSSKGSYSPAKKSIKESLTFFNKLRKISENPELTGKKKKKIALLLLVRYSHLFDDSKYEKYRLDIFAGRYSKVLADQ